MRGAYVWGIACLVVAATSCSVSDRTGLRVAEATMQDAWRKPRTHCEPRTRVHAGRIPRVRLPRR